LPRGKVYAGNLTLTPISTQAEELPLLRYYANSIAHLL
jgi:hypothetical protein